MDVNSGPDSVLGGLDAALSSADRRIQADAVNTTLARCIAGRIDRLVAGDEPISAALLGAYDRSLVRLGLAGGQSAAVPSSSKLALVRAMTRATQAESLSQSKENSHGR